MLNNSTLGATFSCSVENVGLLLHILQGWGHSVDLAAHSAERQPCRSSHTDVSAGRAVWGEELQLQTSCGIIVYNEVDLRQRRSKVFTLTFLGRSPRCDGVSKIFYTSCIQQASESNFSTFLYLEVHLSCLRSYRIRWLCMLFDDK